MADHIPDPGRHRTLFYGHYANRARAARAKAETPAQEALAERLEKRRCPASWVWLISKIYRVDPLRCRGCGGKLQIVAYINDHFAIKKIFDHLGLLPDEQKRSPPEIRYVPVDDEGRERVAMVPGLQTP